jgi:hypothetical protein
LVWFGNGSLCMIIRYYDTLCYYRQNKRAALLEQAPAANITFLFWLTERTCCFSWKSLPLSRGRLVLARNVTLEITGGGRAFHFDSAALACISSGLSRLQLTAYYHNTSINNITSTSPTRSTRSSIFAQCYRRIIFRPLTNINKHKHQHQHQHIPSPINQTSTSHDSLHRLHTGHQFSTHKLSARQHGRAIHHDRHSARRDLQRYHVRPSRDETLELAKRGRRQQVQPHQASLQAQTVDFGFRVS